MATARRRRNRFYADYRRIDEMLTSDYMARAMLVRVESAKELAREAAPKRSGNYARSFYTDVRIGGSHRSKRIAGVLGNSDPAAYQIEVGTKDTPAHRILRSVIGARRKRGGKAPEGTGS